MEIPGSPYKTVVAVAAGDVLAPPPPFALIKLMDKAAYHHDPPPCPDKREGIAFVSPPHWDDRNAAQVSK